MKCKKISLFLAIGIFMSTAAHAKIIYITERLLKDGQVVFYSCFGELNPTNKDQPIELKGLDFEIEGQIIKGELESENEIVKLESSCSPHELRVSAKDLSFSPVARKVGAAATGVAWVVVGFTAGAATTLTTAFIVHPLLAYPAGLAGATAIGFFPELTKKITSVFGWENSGVVQTLQQANPFYIWDKANVAEAIDVKNLSFRDFKLFVFVDEGEAKDFFSKILDLVGAEDLEVDVLMGDGESSLIGEPVAIP